MVTYARPGVYIDEVPRFPPSIATIDTAIPAFIGYTEKAQDPTVGDLTLTPKKISSMAEYEKYFGSPQKEECIQVSILINTPVNEVKAVASLVEAARSKHIMHYSLQMFFANGGGACYIVSVGAYKPMFGAPLEQTELDQGLQSLAKIDEPTLIIFPEAQNLVIAEFKTLHDAALAQCANLHDRFVIMDMHGDTISLSDAAADLLTAAANFRLNGVGANNLKYGAAYAPNIETVLDFVFDETKTDVIKNTDGIVGAAVKLNSLQSTDHRYYELAMGAIRDMPCTLPPAAIMAGIYASTDNTRGVWKAPANVRLIGVIRPAVPISDPINYQFILDADSGKSINTIRSFTGKGTLVWGGRTLAANDNEWRYISVRRFFNFVEESVNRAMQAFVFEPNDANTWLRVQSMLENFLITLWRQGALAGVKPEHAFYVAVGLDRTMTAQDIIDGRMYVEMGLAPTRPAEFTILKFSYKMTQA